MWFPCIERVYSSWLVYGTRKFSETDALFNPKWLYSKKIWKRKINTILHAEKLVPKKSLVRQRCNQNVKQTRPSAKQNWQVHVKIHSWRKFTANYAACAKCLTVNTKTIFKGSSNSIKPHCFFFQNSELRMLLHQYINSKVRIHLTSYFGVLIIQVAKKRKIKVVKSILFRVFQQWKPTDSVSN